MSNRKILIVTQRFDLNADAVIVRLRELGHWPVRLNYEDFHEDARLSLKFNGTQALGRLRTPNRDIGLDEIRSVYWRLRSGGLGGANAATKEETFARRQTELGWGELWRALDCYWMNYPDHVIQAASPIAQLRQAAAAGFSVPRTLITSRVEDAVDFCDTCGGRIVLKAMESRAVVPPSGGDTAGEPLAIPPSLIDLDILRKHGSEIDRAPCLFQEYVEKTKEFRVTVIGGEPFVAELPSDGKIRTPLGWDGAQGTAIAMRAGQLPEATLARCLSLVQGWGLNYCVVDLAVASDGRIFFLEGKPESQCFLVERKVPQLAMIDAVARCLISGESLRRPA